MDINTGRMRSARIFGYIKFIIAFLTLFKLYQK